MDILKFLNGKGVKRMDKRYAFCLITAIFAFTLAFAGCQKKEEPAPAATSAPAAGAPAGAGAVALAPGGETSPGAAAVGETKTAEKKEEGTKK